MTPVPITIGRAATLLGVKPWQVRRVFERGALPEPARVGAYRVVTEGDLPIIKSALQRLGYLKAEAPHVG